MGYALYRCLSCNGMNRGCKSAEFRCACSWTCGIQIAAELPPVSDRERFIPDVLPCPGKDCHGFCVPWEIDEEAGSPIPYLWEFYHPARAEIRRANGKAEADYFKAGGLMVKLHPTAQKTYGVADKLAVMAMEAGLDPSEIMRKIHQATSE